MGGSEITIVTVQKQTWTSCLTVLAEGDERDGGWDGGGGVGKK